MSASTDPTTEDTPATPAPPRLPVPATTASEPVDPVDAWMVLHAGVPSTGPRLDSDQAEPGRIEAARRLMSRRTLEPRLEWLQWYLLIGALLLIVCLLAGTPGWLIGWTIAALTMMAWPLFGLQRTDRRRLIVAGAVLFAVLLIAWQLDAHTNLGALALVGNRDAVISISVLAAILGALTGTRRWLVVQSGIWCLAIAGSGWWLAVRSRSLGLLSDWQQFLPEKYVTQFFAEPLHEPFDMGGVLWLSLASAALFATCAYAGVLIGELARGKAWSAYLSLTNVITVAIWLGVLLVPDGKRLQMGMLLLLLVLIAGTRASRIRELVPIASALAAGVLTREVLEVARNGLLAWWGPTFCDGFLFSECRPSGDLFNLIAGSGLMLGAAALGFYGRHWMAGRARSR